MITGTQFVRRERVAAALGVLVLITLAGPAGAQGWPALRHGTWDITRTMDAPGGGAPKAVTTQALRAVA